MRCQHELQTLLPLWISEERPAAVLRLRPGPLLRPDLPEVRLEETQAELQTFQTGDCSRQGPGLGGHETDQSGRSPHQREGYIDVATE